VWLVFSANPHVLQYQLVQHEPQRFELKLATVDERAFQSALELARPQLARLLGSEAQIDAVRRTEVDIRPGAKFRAVVSMRRPQG
jgi:hypothetical protein